MELSKRLSAVANEVLYDTIADIGTDHGYLPVYLIKNDKIKKAIACDVNKGPLEKAAENIKLSGLENEIKIRLGDGLSCVSENEAETIVIAGMGGILICKILDEGKSALKTVKQLVLQPQRDFYCVRKKAHEHGFKIINEVMVFDAGKYYNIINAVKGVEKYSSEKDYFFGKILLEKKTKVFTDYIEERLKKYEDVLSHMSENNHDYKKIAALTEEYKEVFYECRKNNTDT
ncbi:MAG: class I SAM-dependent methyltransferase [Clostridia bacterium]|jgi:tRNA (adenine22-N1)-methyltransferase|nr:class I SAM-dependent methyltransferase [Clostridia bacterium]